MNEIFISDNRNWEKGRGTVIQFNPKIGSIHSASVDLENSFMMVASAERGKIIIIILIGNQKCEENG